MITIDLNGKKIVPLRQETIIQIESILRELYTWLDKDARYSKSNRKIKDRMNTIAEVLKKMIHDPEELIKNESNNVAL